jgi:hypothetical protein
MKKKTPPRIGINDTGNEEDQFNYRYFGGFWKLKNTKEIPYFNKKKLKEKVKKYDLPLLIELDMMRILWHPDSKKEKAFPFHLYRKKIITTDFFSEMDVSAKYEFGDNSMIWRFVLNFNPDSYSVIEYHFIKDN